MYGMRPKLFIYSDGRIVRAWLCVCVQVIISASEALLCSEAPAVSQCPHKHTCASLSQRVSPPRRSSSESNVLLSCRLTSSEWNVMCCVTNGHVVTGTFYVVMPAVHNQRERAVFF